MEFVESTELDVEYPLAALSPCAAIIAQGVIPTAPKTPTLGYSIKTLELYRLTHFRCPRLSHQAFVQSMADLQGVSIRHPIPVHSLTPDSCRNYTKNTGQSNSLLLMTCTLRFGPMSKPASIRP